MSKGELDKLRILLSHWIEHNKEHGEEFREWAKRASDLGESTVREDMLGAAQYMDQSGESLLRALEKLGEGKS